MSEGEGEAAYFIRKASNGQFYWILKATNGEVLATSETYTRREDAERGVEAAKRAARNAE